MQVLINSDHNITLTESSIGELESVVRSSLAHLESQLTRVEVHVSDQSAGRPTDSDIRCLLEARPEGQEPQITSDNASTVDDAMHGALRKMLHALDARFGRLDHRKGASSMGGIEPR